FCQAEDGIRDDLVTGVQTCALPIFQAFGNHPGFRLAHAKGIVCEGTFQPAPGASELSRAEHFNSNAKPVPVIVRFSNATGVPRRSEERRVGKEATIQRLWEPGKRME